MYYILTYDEFMQDYVWGFSTSSTKLRDELVGKLENSGTPYIVIDGKVIMQSSNDNMSEEAIRIKHNIDSET